VQSAVRRAPRDAFFKSDATGAVPVKTDTNLRERDIDKESERPVMSSVSKPVPRDAENYIGFASLPNQVYRKSVKRGFEFTLMVVGKSSYSLFVLNRKFFGFKAVYF